MVLRGVDGRRREEQTKQREKGDGYGFRRVFLAWMVGVIRGDGWM